MNESKKILIADDEQACIDLVRDALADAECEVISAMDGKEALSIAQQQDLDLIILDVQMPEYDGYEVFSKLRADKKLAKIPVIMLTAVAERTGVKTGAADMGQFLGEEPDAYLDKPIEPIILKQAAKKLLKNA